MRLSLLLLPPVAAAAAAASLVQAADATDGLLQDAAAAVTDAAAASELYQLPPAPGTSSLEIAALNSRSSSDSVGGQRLAVRQLGEGGPEGWACSPAAAAAAADDNSSSSRRMWACTDPTSLDPATCVLSEEHAVWVCKPVDDKCARQRQEGEWDLRLHLIALFVVLGTSLLGCSSPLVALPFLAHKWPRRILFGFRHFGTGVFLATAFVHLLFESFTDFSNPCIGGLAFEPAAPAIAMASLLVIFFIDYSLARFMRSRARERALARRRDAAATALAKAAEGEGETDTSAIGSGMATPDDDAANAHTHNDSDAEGDEDLHFCPSGGIGRLAAAAAAAREKAAQPTDLESQTGLPATSSEAAAAAAAKAADSLRSVERAREEEEAEEAELEARKQARADVYLLEGGVVFHSVMIGVALGAGSGTSWLSFFIAICVHQFFEGLGLGSRIALLHWPAGQGWRKWLLAAIFGLITPFGMAIGMALQSSYNPNSASALLSVAVLNSLSAGILLYAATVELLVADFMHGEMRRASWPKVGAAMSFILLGAACMSAVGKFA